MYYKTDTNTVKGFMKDADGELKEVNVAISYKRTWSDETITLTAGGISITVNAKDMEVAMKNKAK